MMPRWFQREALILGLLAVLLIPVRTIGRPLTLVHPNDLHSHLLGFGPNLDYSPASVGDDKTVGGLARIATIIRNVRTSRGGPVLVVDAGDFLMGSLFHTVSREEGGELRLLGALGYDAVTLGNHEFDLKPLGLAAILRAAAARGSIPPVVAANAAFDPEDPRDDALQLAFRELEIRPYRVLSRDGLKVGILGLVGRNAAEVAPFARPVRFKDPVETAHRVVQQLREKEGVDLVVCLSHSGLSEDRGGEDVDLAREVSGIDVIVSGHTHTVVPEPIRVGSTLIVQAGCYGQYVGVLDLDVDEKACRMTRYRLAKVDDSILGDSSVQAEVAVLQDRVSEGFLKPRGFTFHTLLAEMAFPLTHEPWGESNQGDLVADAIRWAIDEYELLAGKATTPTRVAFESNGLLRDPILPGERGLLALCDLFRAFPLGFGPDGEMGYPLLSVHLTASEIRKALEILTTVAPMKGTDYVLQVSGIRFTYNPRRIPFDRVVDIWIQEEDGEFHPLDASSRNAKLYKVGANLYNATFLKIIGGFTHGILTIVPKDRNGRPIEDLDEALVDRDPSTPGVQELKEWEALLEYVRHFPDEDGDGLPEIPMVYKTPQGRVLPQPTWHPFSWFRNVHWITWAALGGQQRPLFSSSC